MHSRSVQPSGLARITSHDKSKINLVRSSYDALACNKAEQRKRGRFIGEVISMRVVPRSASFWLEIVIGDGTGKINGWFFGRKSIAGMRPGSLVLFEGLVQLDEGEMTIANPYYQYV